MKKRLTTLLVIAAMIITVMPSGAFAAESFGPSPWTATTYRHNPPVSDYLILNGIDVSVYQPNVDWFAAKKGGVDFAIIRVGGRGYAEAGRLYDDVVFAKNMREAKAAGIMVGAYFFSMARTNKEAAEEVDYAIDLITAAGYGPEDFDLPLFMDYERPKDRLSGVSKAKKTSVALYWLEYAKSRGYTPGFYTYLNFANKSIDGARIAAEHNFWTAQYNFENNFSLPYIWWQYSSSGSVPGANVKSCDVNFWYVNKQPRPTSDPINRGSLVERSGFMESTFALSGLPATSILYADASLGQSAFSYNHGNPRTTYVSVTYGGERLMEGRDYALRFVNNVNAGTGYALIIGRGRFTDYKLVPFNIEPLTDLSGIGMEEITSAKYTGKEIKPALKLFDADGNALRSGIDYSAVYSNNIQAGIARVRISFIRNFTGTIERSFEIKKAKQQLTIVDTRNTVDTTEPPYTLGVSPQFLADITYASSDESVATVSPEGVVTPLKRGNTTITVTAKETPNTLEKTETIELKVTQPKLEQVITTKYTKYRRDTSGKGFTITPQTSGDGLFYFASSNPAIATIDEFGKVNIVGDEIGTVEFTITASETDEYKEATHIVRLEVSGLTNAEKAAQGEAKANQANLRIIAGVEATRIKLTSSKVKSGIKVSWTKNKVDGTSYRVDYYQVYRSLKKSSGYGKKPVYTTETGSRRYFTSKAATMEKGSRYYFKVRGVRVIDGKKYYTKWSNKAYRIW